METESNPPPLDLLPGRRTFFGWLTYGLGALAAAMLGFPVAQYFLSTWPRRVLWVKLGPVDSFAPGVTQMVSFDSPLSQPWDGQAAHTGVFVRYQGQDDNQQPQFLVLAVNCAHLGCPVTWFPQSELFMCPCHGGVYYANGERASGPPPRGLFRCVWRVHQGNLEVQAPHYPSLHDTLDKSSAVVSSASRVARCGHA
jgi:Rieske Fe-S protein